MEGHFLQQRPSVQRTKTGKEGCCDMLGHMLCCAMLPLSMSCRVCVVLKKHADCVVRLQPASCPDTPSHKLLIHTCVPPPCVVVADDVSTNPPKPQTGCVVRLQPPTRPDTAAPDCCWELAGGTQVCLFVVGLGFFWGFTNQHLWCWGLIEAYSMRGRVHSH